MALALGAAAIFGGFYYWARRQGLVATQEGQPRRRVPLVTEVVAYIGVILLSGGVAAVGQQWNHVSAWGHVAAFAGATAFLFLAGFMLRGVRELAIQRLVSVLWLLSVACVAGAAGYLVHGVILSPAGPDGGATALGAGGLPAQPGCRVPRALQPQMALLDLQSADGIRRGYCLLRETFGGRLAGVIIQAAAGAGLITPGLRDGWPYTPASGPGAVHTGESGPGLALPKR